MDIDTAVVLAAGEGTRLRPLTRNRPKPMLPAANRPILEHVFDALVDAGVEKLIAVVGYKRDRVQDHFGPTYRGVPVTYAIQHKQLGSGHALLQARDSVDGPALVLNGDRLIDAGTVEAVAETFSQSGNATMSVVERQETSRYGAVQVRDGYITDLVEKPREGDYRLINGGVYAFSQAIFDAIQDTPRQAGELALTDTLATLVDEERVRGVEVDGMWVDATYPWDLLTVAREVLARGRVVESARRKQVWIADSARVHNEAVLQGPVVVGPDCEVGPDAVIGPDAALGRTVTVGANSVVQNSVLDADTRVDPGSTLLDTVTGQDVHLGATTVVPGGPADVQVGTRIFEDQRLGAVIADRARARGDVSFTPGSLVGPNATLDAGVTVRGNVREGAEVTR
ncbi:bifunctional sugar-1-phosphate nucleotidylyltransferase/acetyltransferase [Haloarcula nitratireducens]|uniref:Bifunctional protein GlmU n=1 Tax=Haloarcula nitratireducens TaxID=2487749 RepID=A0AAW4PKA9_9EURY|nr:bifunctional sugar-1-phosphate nucleotidylyltransferase/acetyltransferase [Halomicroarcula nitratireducens]MBX0297881.1 NTP transferase domain-containing protein [Halomicroarcula nitratireducens]